MKLFNSVKRTRVVGEITPERVEHAGTYGSQTNDALYNAQRAVDLYWITYSRSYVPSGTTWFRLTLYQVHCIHKVISYLYDTSPIWIWTCGNAQCTCTGESCRHYSLTVSTEGIYPTPANLSTAANCGDTIKIDHDTNGASYGEILVVEQS